MQRSSREARRFNVGNRQALEVLIGPSGDGEHAILRGETIDLARGGVRLSLETQVPIPDEVTVRLQPANTEPEILIKARVRWRRPVGDESWWVGCMFDDNLTEDVISKLAAAGYLDRRQDPRGDFAAVAMARSEIGNEDVPVRIINCSAGGFSMIAKNSIPAGHGVRVKIRPDVTAVIAKVHWNRQERVGWTIGCGFISGSGYRQLRQQLVSQIQSCTQPETAKKRSWLEGLLQRS